MGNYRSKSEERFLKLATAIEEAFEKNRHISNYFNSLYVTNSYPIVKS